MIKLLKCLNCLVLAFTLTCSAVFAEEVRYTPLRWGTIQSVNAEEGEVIIDGRTYMVSPAVQVLYGENPGVTIRLEDLFGGVLVRYVITSTDGIPEVTKIIRVTGT